MLFCYAFYLRVVWRGIIAFFDIYKIFNFARGVLLHVFCFFTDSLLFSLMKKVTKISSLKIKSLKTTLKFRSAARAVRPSSSTRGLLPLYFFIVFLCFLFKGEEKWKSVGFYFIARFWGYSLRARLEFLAWYLAIVTIKYISDDVLFIFMNVVGFLIHWWSRWERGLFDFWTLV